MATDYCTESDILENMRGVDFNSQSAVTDTALGNMITQESQFMDGFIQGRYNLPLTDSDALTFLKKICIDLVVYRVTKVLQPKDQLPLPSDKARQDISTGSAYRVVIQMLKSVKDGSCPLPNTPVKSIKLFSSEAVDQGWEGVIKKDEQQW